jgi:type III pantothenate kinase
MTDIWIALVIGNSRLHWAEFLGDRLQKAWDTPHLNRSDSLPFPLHSPLWIASVVPSQKQIWQSHPNAHFLSLDQVPLQGMYPTLGIDRALAVWGALKTIGSPVLVIDAGTALTFTGAADHHEGHHLVGGAILPGSTLQFHALGHQTAALPLLPTPNPQRPLPPRWALTTEEAIASGILHTIVAGLHSFIQDWRQTYPTSAVVMTGGDRDRLHLYLQTLYPELAHSVSVNSHLIFSGIQAIRQNQSKDDL